MISNIDVDRLLVCTPCFCTASGSEASALDTRFSTRICAWSPSVPILKLTVSVYWPSLVEMEDM